MTHSVASIFKLKKLYLSAVVRLCCIWHVKCVFASKRRVPLALKYVDVLESVCKRFMQSMSDFENDPFGSELSLSKLNVGRPGLVVRV